MHKRRGQGSKIPPWMVTYADLMSLLLCFFVLLLSFAEIDAMRFKRLAGELARAFGVQRDVPAEVVPLGTSAVFDDFAPGEPEPTVRDEVRQSTSRERPLLDRARQARLEERLAALEAMIDAALRDAIADGSARVERVGSNIVIRIEEQGTFPSGSAQVTEAFADLLAEMSLLLVEMPGDIIIDGHTDDVPVRGQRFQSNWDLSAMRAAAVANVLLANAELTPSRLMVVGHADTQPLTDNASQASRARNRRVEITLRLGDDTAGGGVSVMRAGSSLAGRE